MLQSRVYLNRNEFSNRIKHAHSDKPSETKSTARLQNREGNRLVCRKMDVFSIDGALAILKTLSEAELPRKKMLIDRMRMLKSQDFFVRYKYATEKTGRTMSIPPTWDINRLDDDQMSILSICVSPKQLSITRSKLIVDWNGEETVVVRPVARQCKAIVGGIDF